MSDETIKKESMYINQSLSYLEQCVVSLSRRNPGHVPYRQSKLTNVLKVQEGAVVPESRTHGAHAGFVLQNLFCVG